MASPLSQAQDALLDACGDDIDTTCEAAQALRDLAVSYERHNAQKAHDLRVLADCLANLAGEIETDRDL
jgi:hypothetical protein